MSQILDSDKIAHAFLFKGPDGVGKEFLALQFAKSIADKYSIAKNNETLLGRIEKLNEPYIKYIFALPRGKK